MAKNKIDFSGFLKDYNGGDLDTNLSDQLRAVLAQSEDKDASSIMEKYEWIQDLNKSKALELSDAEISKIRKHIAESPILNVWGKSQLLTLLKEK